MNISNSKKTVLAGLMLAVGVFLPTISHMTGIPGNVFLPMHIPVFLCGFFSGPLYGGICGFVLPYLNSMLTGMPAVYPNAVVMSAELFTYGIVCGIMYNTLCNRFKLRYIYLSLSISMVAGRLVYAICAALILFISSEVRKMSAVAAFVQGIPGIVIQLILVPQIIFAVSKSMSRRKDATAEAVKMIKNNLATCVVVKKDRIISAESPQGIAYIIGLCDKKMLKDTYVADTIIGKAAAMIFSISGVKKCYGKTISKGALEWLKNNKIEVTYDMCVDYIENRTGDGICPMELTVKDVDDPVLALELLKNKIEELNKS